MSSNPPPDGNGPGQGAHPREVVDHVNRQAKQFGQVTDIRGEPGSPSVTPRAAQKNPGPTQQPTSNGANGAPNTRSSQGGPTVAHEDAHPNSSGAAPGAKPAVNPSVPSTQGRPQQGANEPSAPSTGKPSGQAPTGAGAPSEVSKSISQDKIDKKNSSIGAKLRKKPVRPDYVGWKEVGGWDERSQLASDEDVEDLVNKSTLLESYVSDKYYGDWYHNTALIVFASFFSWLIARFGGGIAWLSIVLAFTATAYRTSIRRLRRNVRDDITRLMSLKKLETDTESMEWLNTFLVKFWLIYEPVLSEQVITIGNQVLADATPGFIESLTLDTFTLGTKPPRIDHVRTFPKTDEDVAVMDWKFSFTPNDVEDLTTRQLKNKVNPKIVLGVRVGKGIVSKSLPILVEDMSFSGLMRVRIKMMTTFPHVQTVDVSFLDPPDIDFVLKPIGGDTFGFDINIIPGLSTFIKEMIDANAGPMLYAPNAFQLNVEQMLAGAGLDSAVGVLSVSVNYAKDLKGGDGIGSTMDPYAKLYFNTNQELARTSIKSNTRSPTWKETKHILVKNLNDALSLEVVDFNDFRKDKSVGIATFALEKLRDSPDHNGITSELLSGMKNRGGVSYDLHWYPVLEGKKLDDGTVEPPPESKSGILKLTVHQCKDLDAKKSLVGQLSTYADITLDRDTIQTTKTVKRNNNPVWDHSYEVLVPNKSQARIGVTVRDSRGLAVDPVVGSYTTTVQALLGAEQGQDWYNLSPSGRVRITASWKPVAIKDVGGSSYVEPIGALRVHIKNASDLRNLERVGTIDPYVRVMVGGFQKARTATVESSLNPTFDEVVYVPICDVSQDVTLEAMDVEKTSKDRSLGSFKVKLSKFIKTDSSGNYLPFKSPETANLGGELAMPKKNPKGKISYGFEFYPVLPVMDPDEAKEAKKQREEEEAQKKAEEEANPKSAKEKEEKAAKEKAAGGAADTEGVGEGAVEQPSKGRDLVEVPLDQLVQSDAGVFAVTVDEVQQSFPQSFLKVYFDAASYAALNSSQIKGSRSRVSESGDFMVRELQYSQTIFEFVPKDDTRDDTDVFASLTVPTLQLLKDSYDAPKTLNISGRGGKASIKVRARFFPAQGFELNPAESVRNQGQVHVEVVSAKEIEAADRGNRSDPYLAFLVDGNKVYQSETIKKTLNPTWNESFDTSIKSRISSQFIAELYDWDIGPGADDFLGRATIPLADIEPEKLTDLDLPLKDHKGTIQLRVGFKPGYVRAAKGSGRKFSVTNPAGAVMSGGGKVFEVGGKAGGMATGAATGVVGGVVGGVGSGVGKGAGLLKSAFGRGHKNKDTSNGHDAANSSFGTAGDTSSVFDDSASVAASSSPRKRAGSMSSDVSGVAAAADSIVGSVTVIGVRGIEAAHLQIRAYLTGKREKELFKSKTVKPSSGNAEVDETFSFKAASDASLVFRVREHKSIGRDSEIGQASFSVADISGDGEQTLSIGSGELVIRLSLGR